MTRKVLVVKRELLESVGLFQGYSLEVGKYLDAVLDIRNHLYLDRHLAEKNSHYKQIIPYVVLRHKDSIFVYVRGYASNEKRLVGRRSIGLGGHIEESDRSLSKSRDLHVIAARRELEEEVKIESSRRERIVALINDDSTNVGRVHFGIMHVWDLDEPRVINIENNIIESGFYSLASLRGLPGDLESWSKIALQALNDPLIPTYLSPLDVA